MARDDNRDYYNGEFGYWPGHIIHNDVANTLRLAEFDTFIDQISNSNNALYGSYKVPQSDLNLIFLDGFDQGDNYGTFVTSRGDFRHGWTHFTPAQQEWLSGKLDDIQANGQKALIFTHIMFHTLDWKHSDNPFAEIRNKNTNEYYPNVYEGEKIKNIIESHSDAVLAVFGGHTHADDFVVENNVTYVTTTCALPDRGDGYNIRKIGTDTESAFDILQINTKSTGANIIRHRVGWHMPNDSTSVNGESFIEQI